MSSIAPHPGGGVLVGGWFNLWDGELVPDFVRLQSDGGLDRGFLANQPPAHPNARTSIGRILVLADGRFLVGGAAVWRLASDGRVEASVPYPSSASAWTGGPEGSIWFARVGGRGPGVEGIRVERILPDGTADPAWNRTYACDRAVVVLNVQGDGKLLLGGDFTMFGGGRRQGLVRLNADGSVDDGFVAELELPADGGWADDRATIAAWQLAPGSGDAWYVRGVFTNAAALSVPGLARLRGGDRPAGPPVIREAPRTLSRVEGTTARLGFLVESASTQSAGWTRDGAVVPGIATPAWVLEDLRLADAGEYTLSVTNAQGVATSASVRLEVIRAPSQPGTVDVTFTAPRLLSLDEYWLAPIPIGGALPAKAGGGFFAWSAQSGFLGFGGHLTTNLARFLPDGAVDTGFVAWRGEEAPVSLRVVLPLGDGGALVEGTFADKPPEVLRSEHLVLLKPDGSRDPAFRLGVERASVFGRITALLEDSDGRFLVGGSFRSADPQTRWNLIRIRRDGALDPSYSPVVLPGGALKLVPQSGGRLLVVTVPLAGEGGLSPRILRFFADGTPDPTFQCSPMIDDAVLSLVVDSRDRLLVGLDTAAFADGGHPILLRLLPDGALDPSFNRLRDPVPSRRASLEDLALQADGRIVARPSYNVNPDGTAFPAVIRLGVDGEPDPTFEAPAVEGWIESMWVTPADQIMLAGAFRDLAGTGRTGLARLNGHDEHRIEAGRAVGPGAGGAFEGNVWTRLGRRYVVESAADLAGAPWQGVVTLEGDGSRQTFPSSAGGERFFRARIEDHRTR